MSNEVFKSGWIDAHCHLADDRLIENATMIIKCAAEAQIGLVSSALCRFEYDFHARLDYAHICWTAGIHPYYDRSSIDDFDLLVELCEKKAVIGIGEIGLDMRKPNHEYQVRLLKMQLELAMNYSLPVHFHIVKRHNELYRILHDDFPGIRGYVHGFNGSIELFRQYRQLGLFVSLGGRITNRSTRTDTLREIVRSGCYLLETDAPYQKPDYITDTILTPLHLPHIAEQIASLTDTPLQAIMETQRKNFRELYGI